MKKFLFFLLVCSFGSLALVSQVVLIRQLLAAYGGTEILVSLVLASWLAGVFAGARVIGRVAAWVKEIRLCLSIMLMIWLAVIAVLITMSYHLHHLAGLMPGEVASFEQTIVWTLILTVPASFFVGGLFVAAGAYLNIEYRHEKGRQGLGAVIFWLESAGSCAGLLLYTHYLADRIGPIGTLSLYVLPVLVLGALVLPDRLSRRVELTVAILLIAVFYFGFHVGTRLDDSANRARFHDVYPAYRLLESRDTPYQHLSLASRNDSFALFGNQKLTAFWPDPAHYQVLTLFFLSEAASFDRVLLAGQGPGGFIHELLKRRIKQLVYVALDPEETELAVRHLPSEMVQDMKDPRLTLIHDDIRRFMRHTDQTFDLIIINAPDPDNARINRLYTLEFYQSAKARLSPNGVLITSISGAENYWSPEMRDYGYALYKTLKAVFPEVLMTPGDQHYLLAGASPGLISADPDVLAERYRSLGFDSRYFTPRSMFRFFPPSGVTNLREQLRTASEDGPARMNTDASPLSYFLRLRLWEKMTGRPWMKNILDYSGNVRNWGPFALVLVLLPLAWVTARPRPASAASWTIALTGGVVMALQILLIYAYQNRYGIIYRQIGLLTALYMGGLAAGGVLGRIILAIRAPGRFALSFLEVLMVGAACLTALTGWNRIPNMIPQLIALIGLVGGLEFSLFFSFYLRDESQPDVKRALSGLEAADHGGAVLGALFTGLALAPILGLGTTAAVLAGLKLVNALALLRVKA